MMLPILISVSARARIVFRWREPALARGCRAVAALGNHHAEMRRRIARSDQGLAGGVIVLRLHRSRRLYRSGVAATLSMANAIVGMIFMRASPKNRCSYDGQTAAFYGSVLVWFASC